jgi:hypothetical protein
MGHPSTGELLSSRLRCRIPMMVPHTVRKRLHIMVALANGNLLREECKHSEMSITGQSDRE